MSPKIKVGDRVLLKSNRLISGTVVAHCLNPEYILVEAVAPSGCRGVKLYRADEWEPPLQLAFDISIPNFDDRESKVAVAPVAANTWKQEGRCPQCGALGHFDRSLTMICPTHGPY